MVKLGVNSGNPAIFWSFTRQKWTFYDLLLIGIFGNKNFYLKQLYIILLQIQYRGEVTY